MRKIVELLLQAIAVISHKAAVFSAGTASCCGMYEPEMPEELR